MEEDAFPTAYDPDDYQRPSVAVDCVVLGLNEGELSVLLVRRDRSPFADCWALPGGFVVIDESLDAAAARVLAEKAGLADIAVEQVQGFGAVDRDPRMRIIAIAYRALLDPARMAAVTLRSDQCFARIDRDGGLSCDGHPLQLAFDHGDILRVTLGRLRAGIDDAAFALVPDHFTLRELQCAHEAVLGRDLNKPAFRRRMLERGVLQATGAFEAGRAFRPAERYVHVPKG